MKLGSLFDGSGGFPLAGAMCGIEPVWASEIEPFPIKVTTARFPGMKHLGDVTKINGAEIEPVDIITFGSPCQDLSVGGHRKGVINGERSSLFFEAVRIIKEMREHDRSIGRTNINIRPRYIVWENVCGAMSSNAGFDFLAVLQALCEISGEKIPSFGLPSGGWSDSGCVMGNGFSIAWKVYDARDYVPQRRKRIFLIADFASRRAGKILFESEGLRRDFAQSAKAWENASKFVNGCVNKTGGETKGMNIKLFDAYQHHNWRESETIGTLTTLNCAFVRGDTPLVAFIPGGYADYKEGNYASTLRATKGADLGGGSEALILDKDYLIRRLTPTECARLQGFPDWWTDGVEGSDTAKYTMWGNGVCLPCVVDVIGRLEKEMKGG